MRIFLIDFENVNEGGLSGLRSLSEEDRVILFFTRNAGKVSLGLFNGSKASFTFIEVPGGKQSLDMHLTTYLGYLIGKEEDAGTLYYIISNDTDYVNPLFMLKRMFCGERIFMKPSVDGMSIKLEPAQESVLEPVSHTRGRNRGRRRRPYGTDRVAETMEAEAPAEMPEMTVEAVEAEEPVTEGMDGLQEVLVEEPAAIAVVTGEVTVETVEPAEPATASAEAEEAEAPAEPAEAEKEPAEKPHRRNRGRRRKPARQEQAAEQETPATEAKAPAVETPVNGEEPAEEAAPTEAAAEAATEAAGNPAEEPAAEQAPAEKQQRGRGRQRTASGERNGRSHDRRPSARGDHAQAERPASTVELMSPIAVQLLSLGEPEATAKTVADIVAAQPQDKSLKQTSYRAMVKTLGQKEGLRLYNLIKKSLS